MNDDNSMLNEAGVILTKLAHTIKQEEGPLNDKKSENPKNNKRSDLITKSLKKVNKILGQVDPEIDLHKYAALQSAIRSFELLNNDTNNISGNIKIFKKHVEAITGGPEAVKFGGKRIGKKLTSDEYYLRAAAVVLWKFYKKHKQNDAIDQLVLDARSVIKVGSKKKLAKLVDNFEQNHDITLKNSKSPLSPHIGGIEDLVKNHGYLKLNDFV